MLLGSCQSKFYIRISIVFQESFGYSELETAAAEHASEYAEHFDLSGSGDYYSRRRRPVVLAAESFYKFRKGLRTASGQSGALFLFWGLDDLK